MSAYLGPLFGAQLDILCRNVLPCDVRQLRSKLLFGELAAKLICMRVRCNGVQRQKSDEHAIHVFLDKLQVELLLCIRAGAPVVDIDVIDVVDDLVRFVHNARDARLGPQDEGRVYKAGRLVLGAVSVVAQHSLGHAAVVLYGGKSVSDRVLLAGGGGTTA